MPSCIHTLDARDNVLLPIARSEFGMSPERIFREIQAAAESARDALRRKSVDYSQLKAALVPSADRREAGFVFDTSQIQSGWYGGVVHDNILQLFEGTSSHSVLAGDYLDHGLSQDYLYERLAAHLVPVAPTAYERSNQYYFVYINNLSDDMVTRWNARLLGAPGYVGYIDFTYSSNLKTLISLTLVHDYIVHRRTIIAPHEDDADSASDWNLSGYPFEARSFTLRSVQDHLFSLFLSYKIERPMLRRDEDTEFSLNAISTHPAILEGLQVRLDTAKLKYLMEKKTHSLKSAGLLGLSSNEIERAVRDRLRSNYIYNLCRDEEHSTWRFNTVIECSNPEMHTRFRLTVALAYLPQEMCVKVITMF